MKGWMHYLMVGLLWGAVIAYLIYAYCYAREQRAAARVSHLEVVVVDSTSLGSLIKSSEIRRNIAQSAIRIIDQSIDSVDLAALERLMGRNGFVEKAVAYCSEEGVLYLRLSQREPMLRLRVAGFDCYLTRDGYLFDAPRHTSLYMPVITGSYPLPVPTGYRGKIADYIKARHTSIDSLIALLETEKYPHLALERAARRKVRQERWRRLPRHWLHWLGYESEEEYEERKEAFVLRQADSVRKYRYRMRVNREAIDRLSSRQEELREQQKKLEKSYEDFTKLLTFVEDLEHNDFWRSEVVQIEAYKTPSQELELTLIPRSGSFAICFGRIDEVEEKFLRLEKFYQRGLPVLGWDCFREVDLRYTGRVVCR